MMDENPLKGSTEMKCLIIVCSYHHNNTAKIAHVFSEVLHGQVKTPEEASPEELQAYDLIGFGAGIDSGSHYRPLLDFVDRLPKVDGKPGFIFSTSGMQGESKVMNDHSVLREKLQSKGYIIIDEFSCKGFNTNSFLKYFGGMNKGSPNSEDLKYAEEFALNLTRRIKPIDNHTQ